ESNAPWAMPSACAPIVGRVWSSVASAVFSPVPAAPTIRSPGIVQSLKWISRVGEPLMPSLLSFGPTENPGSSACTTKAEMPSVGLVASGSVTAMTVYQLDAPALVIQALVPLSTHESRSEEHTSELQSRFAVVCPL